MRAARARCTDDVSSNVSEPQVKCVTNAMSLTPIVLCCDVLLCTGDLSLCLVSFICETIVKDYRNLK